MQTTCIFCRLLCAKNRVKLNFGRAELFTMPQQNSLYFGGSPRAHVSADRRILSEIPVVRRVRDVRKAISDELVFNVFPLFLNRTGNKPQSIRSRFIYLSYGT